jgi:hypothetical protein
MSGLAMGNLNDFTMLEAFGGWESSFAVVLVPGDRDFLNPEPFLVPLARVVVRSQFLKQTDSLET